MASIIVISGAAGSGKGTLVKKLTADNDKYFVSRSVTTRTPRGDDIPGVSYHFTTREKFEEMIAAGEFVEHAEYSGNYYGTPVTPINQAISDGRNIILEIDTRGAIQIKKRFPEAILIWITPPDYENLERRLRSRGTNTESDILKRLETAKKERTLLDEYDYVVVNRDGEADKAADEIRTIIAAEELSVKRNRNFPEKFYNA